MKFILISTVIVLGLISELICVPLSDYKEVIDYLNTYEYLSNNEKLELNNIIDNHQHIGKNKRFKRALKYLQRNGNIPITGKVDKTTLALMEKPRCGVGDKELNVRRRKRYALMSSKWHRTNLTWRYIPKKNDIFVDDEEIIRQRIRDAFEVWQRDTIMTFVEDNSDKEPDILISFENPKHSDVDIYAFSAQTLAHAFQPGKGIGGDAHFNNMMSWDFSVKHTEKPAEGKISFFAVALHELGHSLGLGHSHDEDAVMYEYYSRSTSSLAMDDIRGMQHIYGTPPNKKYQPPPKHESEEEMPIWGSVPMKPNTCNTSYDAITVIDNEVLIFRKEYMFGRNQNLTEIKSRWRDLPNKLTHIDAIHQLFSGKVFIVIDSYAYIFSPKSLERQISLNVIGIPDGYKINAVFSWSKETYILSEKFYWILNEQTMKVVDKQPQRITRKFHDVYEMDTAFVNTDGNLYFFRNEHSFEFDQKRNKLQRMKPELSANKFMGCDLTDNSISFAVRMGDNDNSADKDYIDIGDPIDDDFDSNNKEQNETGGKDNASSIKIKKYLILILLSALALSKQFL